MAKKTAESKSAKNLVAPATKRSDGYAILNSLVGHIVVLNPDGTILFTNEAWNRFARENGNPPLRAAEPGANYLEIWKRAVSDGVPGAPAILSGLKGVLAGKQKRFSSEYPCDLPDEQRWFAMNVAPLEGTKGGVVTSHLDITRSKRAEMAVQKSSATIQALLDSVTQSIVAVDQAGNFVIVNASTERMFGYTRGELLEQNLEVLVPEAKRGRHAGYHKIYFDEPQTRPMGIGLELEGRRKDGTVFPVEIGLSTVATPEGRLGVAFVTDITERKRVEALLHQREQEVKTLLDNSPDVVVRFDRDLRYTYANTVAERVTGYPRETMVGKTQRELGMPRHVPGLFDPVLRGVFEMGRPDVFEFLYPTPSGDTYWEARFIPEFGEDGTVASVINFGRDITDRHHLDDALRQREQEVKTLLDNSPDVILRVDREIRYRYVNSTTARVAGLTPEAFLGKTPREVGLPENLCDLWARTLKGVFDSGLPQIIEFSFPSPEAETVWEERLVPEFAADGTVQSVLVIGRDITERKELEKVTETHAAEFRALAARLLTVAEEERRMVSRELHDNLVQQLASLAFDVGGLVAEIPSRNRARNRLQALQARVVKVSEEARHLAYEMHPSMVDDLGLVISLTALCDEFAKEQNIIVEFKDESLPRPIPQEVASGLYRIAQESLQNIVKHAHAKHVTAQLVTEGEELRLSIEDDGVGFDPAAVKGKGGLGLVSMEERARLLGAKLSIESKLGHGTRVAVVVPDLKRLP